jgi:adenine-specific DNA-methyltransferase
MTAGLLTQADRIRVEATLALDPASQSAHGQFFTPDRAAALIADMASLPTTGCLRVLDPGAGTGMLTAALVNRVCQTRPYLAIDVVAVEMDLALMPGLRQTAALCEAEGARSGNRVTVRIVEADAVVALTGRGATVQPGFDLVLMNPPYRKLAASSTPRHALSLLGWQCPNLYAVFLALGVEVLNDGGQVVAITPRSFANGPYFGPFRRRLLSEVSIDRVHTFESRSSVFADTGVLQENLVFAATRGTHRHPVQITSSHDHRDRASIRLVAYDELVRRGDPEQFIRITTSDLDDEATQVMLGLPSSLPDLDVSVSTGRVVDFRARDNLLTRPEPDAAPLVYPGNVRSGTVMWPRDIGKPQGFAILGRDDDKALMPAGCYVLVKRFSSKEERRRIVAAVWDPDVNSHQPVAFENHLNVFHRAGSGLDPQFAWGLALWLNSTVVDRFFRTFSGHTQVNATDLRNLRYPDESALISLAKSIDHLPGQDDLDLLVDRALAGALTRQAART